MVEGRKRRTPRDREPDISEWSEEEKQKYLRDKALATPVAEMKLPVRVVNTLEANNIIMASDLVKQTYAGLMGMTNFGDKTMLEVSAAIVALGLEPPQWIPPPKAKRVPRSKPEKHGFMDLW